MRQLLGDETEAFLEALAAPSPISINLHIEKQIKWEENFRGVKWNNKGVYLPERPSFTFDPAFHAGAYYVQEAGSMMIAEAARQLLPADRPVRALDLCAAPGGKSTLLANVLPPGSLLLSNEVIRSRYGVLRYNLDKWGLPGMGSSQHDSADFSALAGWFDLVLVDAPCSGEGMFRKDPDAIAEWSPAHIAHCAARQRRILAEATALVRPGGSLIYSTCTYNEAENDQNAAWLLEEYPDWALRPLAMDPHWGVCERAPGYQLYPHRVEGEGLYLCCFVREGEQAPSLLKRSGSSGFRKLTAAPKAQLAAAARWLKDGDAHAYWIEPSGRWRAFAENQAADWQWLSAALPRLEAGWVVGELKGKDMIPAPELALSVQLTNERIELALTKEEAISYLRKETPHLPQTAQGWALVSYQNLGLGWIKGLGSRYNNYYPTEWRIRK
jgi:16S rRNA C967 or C1407 C5-methylase (RsmB/RsmF family)/NOL1/NOP2/fmu family ribosome biogenesis protein